jgi:hypothetical protein
MATSIQAFSTCIQRRKQCIQIKHIGFWSFLATFGPFISEALKPGKIFFEKRKQKIPKRIIRKKNSIKQFLD